jgi:antitoxin VapB
MPSATTRVFKSGNSVAVRFPVDMDLEEGTEVTITKIASGYEIRPTRKTFKALIDALNALPSPSEIEVRDTEEIPEPKGL